MRPPVASQSAVDGGSKKPGGAARSSGMKAEKPTARAAGAAGARMRENQQRSLGYETGFPDLNESEWCSVVSSGDQVSDCC